MRINFLIILFLCSMTVAFAQQSSSYSRSKNIVPNPSFEEFGSYPLGWFYKGKDYNRLMKYWTSATYASPDVYSPKVRIPIYWTQKGFGIERPRTGDNMSGITVYGCTDGKPHCREYIQIRLMEPLVVGQKYHVEFYTASLQEGKSTNNLGVHFSKELVNETIDDVLDLKPQIKENKIIRYHHGSWTKVEGSFVATENLEYLIIGNFFEDSLTLTMDNPKTYKYGYYYIDDVMVKKEEPIIDVPKKPDDLCCLKYEIGKSFELKNIFFETDKSELLPQSYRELDKLVQVLNENPNMEIEIHGHTDNQGTDKHNINLSQNRAEAVVNYLRAKEISYNRLAYKGYGDTKPISTNETESGRQLNRRVEFLILKK